MRTASLAQGALLALALPVAAGSAVASLAQGAPRRIEILVVDRGGKPLPGAKVRFAVEDEDRGEVDDPFAPGGKRQALRFDTPPSASSVDRPLKGRPEVTANAAGKIHIPCPEEKALLVSARHSDRWSFLFLPRDWSETAGRAHPPGEPVRLELAPDWDLRVSVVDERGRPLANVPVRVRSRPFNTGTTSDRARELVFEHVGFELRDATEPLDVYVDAPLAPPVRATLDPKRPPAGPITLRMPPTGSVEVSVVDPSGKPLLRRPVIVGLRITTDEPPVSERRFDGFAPYHVRPTRDGKARFDHVSLGQNLEVFVQLREGDSQKLRGPLAPGETVSTTLTLEPADSADRGRAGPSPSPPATGSLRGRLLLDPGIPARAIEIKLYDDSPAARRAALSPLLSADGAFSFSSVPVGPARLEVSTHGFLPAAERRPLFQARVEVAAGGSPATDPVEIDLRGKVFAHTIALKGLERERDFQASAFFAPARQSQRSRVYLRTTQLPVVLVSPWEVLDVEIRVPGHRDVSLLDLRERATVELEPGIPVRLRLRTDGALPEPPRYLKAALIAVEESHQGIDWGGPAFDAKGEILIYAGKPGRAKVFWIAAKHEGSGGSGGIRDTVRAQHVVVRDVPQEQVFDVSLSAAELAEILRQLE